MLLAMRPTQFSGLLPTPRCRARRDHYIDRIITGTGTLVYV